MTAPRASRSALSGITALFLMALAACSSGGSPAENAARADGGTPDETTDLPPTPPSTTPACGKAVAKTGYLGSQSIRVAGVTRTYELTLPAAYDGTKLYPLVLVFHGDGGDGAGLRSYFPIEEASGDGAVFVYPDGQDNTWNIDQDPAGATLGDIAVVDAIIAEIQKTYCIDATSVFATGFSKGAYFVNQLACRTKSKLAGIVTHSGGGPFGISDAEFDANGNLVCPSPAVPAMQVQGASDGEVDPSEGEKARDHWSQANSCGQKTSSVSPSPCVAYQGCSRPEIWCLVPGMGHSIWSEGASATWGFVTSLSLGTH